MVLKIKFIKGKSFNKKCKIKSGQNDKNREINLQFYGLNEFKT